MTIGQRVFHPLYPSLELVVVEHDESNGITKCAVETLPNFEGRWLLTRELQDRPDAECKVEEFDCGERRDIPCSVPVERYDG